MARKLIIGAIEGYTFAQIRLFFTSLRATPYDGKVVLFHRDLSPTTLEQIRAFEVQLIPLEPRGVNNPFTGRLLRGEGALGPVLQALASGLRSLPLSAQRREHLLTRFVERFYHIANARFVLAHEYLAQHVDRFDAAMLTDVRDVYFQDDPFAHPATAELCTFSEDPSITLRTNRNYREWIAAACGTSFVEKQIEARLACCAVTLGPAAPMLEYLGQMSLGLRAQTGSEPFGFGLDSAIHNLLLLQKSVPGLRALEPFVGPALHLGGIPPAALGEDPVAALRDTGGRPIAVIHQFDRHPQLVERLENAFA